MVVKQTVMPLSISDLLRAVESNKFAMMFLYPKDMAEIILRNSSGELAPFGKAMEKYSPIYWHYFPNKQSWAAKI